MENRRRRLGRRLMVAAPVCAALLAAYWFTRPPELVLWKGPVISNSTHHLRVLIPRGWETWGEPLYDDQFEQYFLVPTDKRPRLIRRLLPAREDGGKASLGIQIYRQGHFGKNVPNQSAQSLDIRGKGKAATCWRTFEKQKLTVFLIYSRADRKAFERTYKQICESVMID